MAGSACSAAPQPQKDSVYLTAFTAIVNHDLPLAKKIFKADAISEEVQPSGRWQKIGFEQFIEMFDGYKITGMKINNDDASAVWIKGYRGTGACTGKESDSPRDRLAVRFFPEGDKLGAVFSFSTRPCAGIVAW